MAIAAAGSAFRTAWQNADAAAQSSRAGERHAAYDELASWYDNTVFERWKIAALARGQAGLYRQTRGIYNPARRLVDFYAAQIYSGVLTTDARTLPDGVPSAIPFPSDTDPALATACAQLWQWSNWQAESKVMTRLGAMLGNVLVEVDDAVARGKVTLQVWSPRHVKDIDVDRAGNVKGFVLEYRYRDEDDIERTYTRVVTQESFRTYRDERPFAYPEHGGVQAWDNPYGFVPAAWAHHTHTGTPFGAPALAGVLGKLRELNSLASRLHDAIGLQIDSPLAFFTRSSPAPLFGETKRGPTGELDNPFVDREALKYIHIPDTAGKVEGLGTKVNLRDAMEYIRQQLTELEQEKPELVLWRELRQMSQVTGPSVARLMADVGNRLYEVQGNYDTHTVKIHQMAVAIGGYRASNGDWGSEASLTPVQRKFLGFDLASYAQGKLDLEIQPRPLVPITASEVAGVKLQQAQVVKTLQEAGLPLTMLTRELAAIISDGNLTEAQLKAALEEAAREQEARIRREQMLAMDDTANADVEQ
jgi:hypothetical protein